MLIRDEQAEIGLSRRRLTGSSTASVDQPEPRYHLTLLELTPQNDNNGM
jgi:hypothetical protein